MKKVFAVVAITSFFLSGCVVVPDLPVARVVVTDGDGGPHHCPPGQAKKGRC